MAYFSENDIKVIQKSLDINKKVSDTLHHLLFRANKLSAYEDGNLDEDAMISIYMGAAKMMDNMRYLLSSLPTFKPSFLAETEADSLYISGYGMELTPEKWIRAVLPPPTSTNQQDSFCTKNKSYYRRLLNTARCFIERLSEPEREKYPMRHAVVSFKYVMDKNRRFFPDYDNTDSKGILNAICGANILHDDSPDCLTTFYCSAADDFSALIVYILPESDFPFWYESRKNTREKLLVENVKTDRTEPSKQMPF